MHHDHSGLFEEPYRTGVDALGFAGPANALTVRGIEVVQSVQALNNSVTLVAGKATVVRVYLDAAGVAAPATVSGELAWRRDSSGGESYLPAMAALRLDPAGAPDLARQRADAGLSLNFRLPAEAVEAGGLRLRLNRVSVVGGPQVPLAGATETAVRFMPAPPLRVRAVGLRYRIRNSDAFGTPDAIHFAYLRSYLLRAYPISELIWSQIVVDANFSAPFAGSTPDLANAQLAAIRSREVSGGVDPRTHYYGLVDDHQGAHFMRGKAFTIPNVPRPDVVASGPVGVPGGFAGDEDRSYADWYGAHELGHTFGRYHPGFPPYDPQTGRGQDRSDTVFPYPEGRISTYDGAYVGFDVGDPALNLPMRALPGDTHHDVMTYMDRQWVSAYTCEAIFARLMAEDALGAPADEALGVLVA